MKNLTLKSIVVAAMFTANGLAYSGETISLEQTGDLKGVVEDIKKDIDINVDVIIPVPVPQPPYTPTPYPEPYPYPSPSTQILTFESGKFTFASDAEESFDKAINALNAAGYKILESRRNWDKYTIVFIGSSRTRIEKYVSGQYNFISDAEEALARTVTSLQSMGSVVIEQRLNSDRRSFTVNYVSERNQSPYSQILTFQSGKFTFASEAEESFDKAINALNAAGYKILESRRIFDQYTLVFIGPSSSKIEKYVSGQYSFISDAEEALARTVTSLQSMGSVVIEQRLNSDRRSFTVSYVSENQYYPYNPYPHHPPHPYHPHHPHQGDR